MEISSVCSLEGLMLKLKLQYFGHLMRRVDSLEKTLMLGGIGAGGEGDDRGWDGWMASPTLWMWVWVNSRSCWWTGRPGMLWFMGLQRVRHDWVTELNIFETQHHEFLNEDHSILPFNNYLQMICHVPSPFSRCWGCNSARNTAPVSRNLMGSRGFPGGEVKSLIQ